MKKAGRLLIGAAALLLLPSAAWCWQAPVRQSATEQAPAAAPPFLLAASSPAISLAEAGIQPAAATAVTNLSKPPTFASWTRGRKTLLFIRARFADDPRDYITMGEAFNLMEQANQFVVENSYNAVWIISTVTPYVTLPMSKSWYEANGYTNVLGHAHTAAKAAGFDYLDYDLDIVHSTAVVEQGVSSDTGFTELGNRTIGVFSGAPTMHVPISLARTWGLGFAGTWVTGEPNVDNPNNLPVDPDSALGHPALNAPGVDQIRTDPFDMMGDPDGLSAARTEYQFNALEKYNLQWLPLEYVRTDVTSGTTRLYAMDTPNLVPGRSYAMRMRKDFLREYWLDYRQLWTDNLFLDNGIELHWTPWPDINGDIGSLLLDGTPGSPFGFYDAAVVEGRTFADAQAGIFITPVEKGGEYPDQWIDVVVQTGPFPNNRPPTVTLDANELYVSPGETVTLVATAMDPDGDKLSYYWESSDYKFGFNYPGVRYTAGQAGQHVIRCEVSDMKGGVASSLVMVTVGAPSNHSLSGIVIDTNGNPLAGVRVHNGLSGAEQRYCISDSQGNYIIPDLSPGEYNVGAFLFGYQTEPMDFVNPVTVAGGDLYFLDFMATEIPKVNVTLAYGSINEGGQGSFQINRTGPTNKELAVFFRLGGTADNTAVVGTNGAGDFSIPATITNTLGSNVTFQSVFGVTIPAGATSTMVPVTTLTDTLVEGPETVKLSLVLAGYNLNTAVILNTDGTNTWTETNTVSVFYPGWEGRQIDQVDILFQTDPPYVVGPLGEATLNVNDYGVDLVTTVNVLPFLLRDSAVPENGHHTMSVMFERVGPVNQNLLVSYAIGGSASNGVDYASISGVLTIPAGKKQQPLLIKPIDDLFVEGNETVAITVLPDTSSYRTYVAGTNATAIVTIIDDDLPLVTLYAKDELAGEEGQNPGTVVFARSGDLSRALLVQYLVEGTAAAGLDYAALPGSVLIPAGEVKAEVTITPFDDDLKEGNETVTVFVSVSRTYNIGSPNLATVTIQDNEMPTVSVGVATATTEEGGTDPAQFQLTRTGDTANPLTVYIQVGGSALPQFDYASINTSVVFPAGTNVALVSITAINDKYREGDEYVSIQLLAGTNYNLGTDTAGIVTITDNDDQELPEVSFMQRSSTAPAGSGTNLLYVAISADPTTNQTPVNIGYRVLGGNATTNDYRFVDTNSLPFQPEGRLLVFTNGGPQYLTIPLLLLSNRVNPSASKTLIVELFNPLLLVSNTVVSTNIDNTDTNLPPVTNVVTNIVVGAAATNAYLGAYRTHTLNIVDESITGSGGIISITSTNAKAFEEGPVPAAFIVTRSGSTNTPLKISFAVGGTAASRNDYADLGNSVTIPAGAASVPLPLMPLDDPEEELTETVVVTLTGTASGQISPTNSTAVAIILDNDGTIQFLKAEFETAENATNALISVVRTGATNRAAWVDYVISDGTARRGADYLATNGTLYFAPGEVFQTFAVELIDDASVELDEMVALTLTNATGGVPLGGQSTATLTIKDDDTAYTFITSTNKVNEDGGSTLITIQRYGILNLQSSVQFTATNGTALEALDFQAITNQLVMFGAGETSKTVRVTITDDVLFEGEETVNLRLTDPSDKTYLGSNDTATLFIADDECTVAFTSASYATNEFATFVLLEVVRTGGTVNPISVDFATTNGTAKAPKDYDAQQGTVSFLGDTNMLSPSGTGLLEFRPGETNKTIKIPLHDNVVADGDRVFNVVLSKARANITNALAGATGLGALTNAEVKIFDNEQPGWIDYEFYPGAGANGPVLAIAMQFDQSIVFGGDFTTVDGVSFSRVARVKSDGILDTSFNPGVGADGAVLAVASLADGKILIGGAFTNVGGVARSALARLNANGSLDLSFNVQGPTNGVVRALAVQSDGKVIIGGDFASINGQDRRGLARFNVNGTLDDAFKPSFDRPVYALAVQSDDRVIVGGEFAKVGNVSCGRVARLNADGSLDSTFNAGSGADAAVQALAIQSDGQILLGGKFTSLNGVNRGRVARVTAAGAVDLLFDPGLGANTNVNTVALSPSGKIVVGGDFTQFNGLTRNRMARLKRNGAVDAMFDPHDGANDTIRAVVVQANGAIVIGGDFTTVSGVPRNHIARVHTDELLNITSVEFSSPTYQAAENAGEVAITVVRTSKPALACTVEFAVTGITATGDVDFLATNGVLSFAAGEISKTFNVSLVNDSETELDETVLLLLTNGSPEVDLSGMISAVLTIQDDDRLVQLSSASYVVEETNAFVAISIARLGGESGSVAVDYFTTDGTAVAPRDYYAVSGTLIFVPNERFKTVLVPIIDDILGEPAETFSFSLGNPTNASLGSPAEATITIRDNEAVYGTFSSSNTARINILDGSAALPYPSAITVNNRTGVVNRVAVTLNGFTHTYPADVDMLLVGPSGQSVLLMSDAGAGFDVFGATLRFEDAAGGFLPQNAAIISSTNRPTDYEPGDVFYTPAPAGPYGSALSVFNGSSPNGTWSLYIMDDRGSDSGVVSNGWQLTLTTIDPATVVDVAAGMEAAPASLRAGERLTYSISVTNLGPWTATGLKLTDVLPAEFTRAVITPSQGACTNDNGVVTCNLGSLTADAVATVQISGVPVLAGTLTNTMIVQANEPDLQLANNTATALTAVEAGLTADLALSMSGSPNPVLMGQNLTYTMTVHNYGPMDATGVVLTNRRPAGVNLVSALVSQGTYSENGSEVIFEAGSLPKGQSATFVLVVKPMVAGVITSTATVFANEAAINSQNTATVVTTVNPAADLVVTIRDNADPISIDGSVLYLVDVVNNGPSVAHGVSVFYAVPVSLSVETNAVSQGSCRLVADVLVCDLGDLLVGDTATLTVQTKPTAMGTLTNRVTVVGIEADPNTLNNTDLETTTVYLSNVPGAAGIIDNGVVQLGVNRSGSLNAPGGEPSSGTGTTDVGLRYLPTRAEATAPGCLCEGWGAADNITAVSGWADEAMGPTFGLVIESFFADSQTATSVTRVVDPNNAPIFRVTHYYHPSITPNLYQVDVTISNISQSATELLYRRVMDWDVEPTAFMEYSTIIKGDSTNLVFTCNDGFSIPDPLSDPFFNGASGTFVDFGPTDQGALFDFNFGFLQPGEAKSFRTYYGAAGNEIDALKAITQVGAEAYSFGQPSTMDGPTLGTPNTFIFAFGGIGGSALAGSDLTLSQSASPSPAGLGEAVTYTLWVTNRGPENATGVVLTNVLPANVTLVSVNPSKGSYSLGANQITVNFGGLLIGERVRVTVMVMPRQIGSLTNTAWVSLSDIDGNTENNYSQLVTAVLPMGTFGNTDGITIVDAAPAIPYPSSIYVSGLTGVIKKVTVSLMELTHSYPADVDVLLVGPRGQKVVLMSDAGHNYDVSAVTLNFEDDATDLLPGSGQITAGTYRPTDLSIGNPDNFAAPAPSGPYGASLSGYNDTDPNGEWRLFVQDDQGTDSGAISVGWRLTFITGAIEKPQLEFIRSGNSLTISWPETAFGFVLESTASLAPADWQTVSPPPTPVNGRYTYTADLATGSQFYRLRKP